jgi:hypothetical protein
MSASVRRTSPLFGRNCKSYGVNLREALCVFVCVCVCVCSFLFSGNSFVRVITVHLKGISRFNDMTGRW